MKKLIVLLMVAGLFGATPVLAASHEPMTVKPTKFMEKCVLQSETLQDKISKAKAEMAKGSMVYTEEELQTLEQKLKEANDFLEAMGKN
ncbi:MAG: hypothetical protein A2091_10910 [Desulfuromonadales bacterium GWD2_61_12]|nr:MAG: hypothetical protein A2005_08235 [Desulfuromonadales bacterium GWC2_61_20]OGR32044.1 MAG: hypothetical protein A2091_10910 [Desulfuromonadales bacterium GWD2_61_12]HAD04740.1 hypothetical protein [Desulfuromonas sp.]HBT83127.1 hypothetical protein [Desulfuromonas sp.]